MSRVEGFKLKEMVSGYVVLGPLTILSIYSDRL